MKSKINPHDFNQLMEDMLHEFFTEQELKESYFPNNSIDEIRSWKNQNILAKKVAKLHPVSYNIAFYNWLNSLK